MEEQQGAQTFTIRGNIEPGKGIYIERQADHDLLRLCRAGTYAYVLTTRQVGKSSLKVHNAKKLAQEGFCVVQLDLQGYGKSINAEAFYLTLVNDISEKIGLDDDEVFDWWDKQRITFSKRLADFMRQFVLTHTTQKIVIFIDEIDSMLHLEFSDDFFAALRGLHELRADDADCKRLSFVLIGVASPLELIDDPTRTPFNIAERVVLNDFTKKEAQAFASGFDLPEWQAKKLVNRIFKWTDGHPLLTQQMCQDLAENETYSRRGVKNSAYRLFIGPNSKSDNIDFVQKNLLERAREEDRWKVLVTFRNIRWGWPTLSDEKSSIQENLLLAGAIKTKHGLLKVRNNIYKSVFTKDWAFAVAPINQQWASLPETTKSGLTMIMFLMLLIMFLLFRSIEHARIAEVRFIENNASQQTHIVDALKLSAEAVSRSQIGSFWNVTDEANGELLKNTEAINSYYLGHTDRVNDAQYSHDGSMIVTASDDGTVRVWDLNGNELIKLTATVIGDESLILKFKSAQFNSKDDLILAMSTNGIYVWSLTGDLIGQIDQDISGFNSARFNSAGTLILTSDNDGNVKLWTIEGEEKLNLEHEGQVFTAIFSPDETKILTWHTKYSQGHSTLWSSDGEKIITINNTGHFGNDAVFSPEGDFFLTIDRDVHTVTVWSITGKKIVTLDPQESRITTANFSPDGSKILTAGWDGIVNLWSVDGTFIRQILKQSHPLRRVIFNPDGSQILIQDQTHTTKTFSGDIHFNEIKLTTIAGEQIAVINGHSDFILSVQFSPDGSSFVTASSDQLVRLWHTNPKSEFVRFDTSSNVSVALTSYNSTGKRIAVSEYGSLTLWSEKGELINMLHADNNYFPSSFLFSPDGSLIVSEDRNNTLHVWSAYDGSEISSFASKEKFQVNNAKFSPDSSRLLLFYKRANENAYLWLPLENKVVQLDQHNGGVKDAIFNKSGTQILTAGRDGKVILWDSQGNVLDIFDGHIGPIWDIKFAPDEKSFLALGDIPAKNRRDDTNVMSIWDLQKKRIQSTEKDIYETTYSPDGSRIIGGGWSKTYIWSAEGKKIATLESGFDRFSDDGKQIYTDDSKIYSLNGYEVKSWKAQREKAYITKFDPQLNQTHSIGIRDGLGFSSSPWLIKKLKAKAPIVIRLRGRFKEMNKDQSMFLTHSHSHVSALLYSADGKKIAFFRNTAYGIRFSPSGSHILTEGPTLYDDVDNSNLVATWPTQFPTQSFGQDSFISYSLHDYGSQQNSLLGLQLANGQKISWFVDQFSKDALLDNAYQKLNPILDFYECGDIFGWWRCREKISWWPAWL